jgi:uncharacterized protein YggE
MVDGPVVAVRGESVREVAPEVARFSVTVAARDRDRQATLSSLASRAEAVRALIDGYGEAIERREAGSLQVRPELKGSREKVVAYVGSVTTTVTVTDFAVLGELMLRLADQDQSSVSGPWWELRPASPIYREGRRAAIADAISLAREYAEALGARVTGLIEVSDAGMRPQPMMASRAMSVGFKTRDMAAEAAPEIDLDPQAQTVHSAVEARFSISEPTALAEPVD